MAGPAVQFGKTLLTGEDTSGFPLHEKVKPGESETLADLKAALLNLNPAVAAITEANKPRDKNVTATEKAMQFLGPIGLKYRKTPPEKPLPPK
jgi:hypothetical protein